MNYKKFYGLIVSSIFLFSGTNFVWSNSSASSQPQQSDVNTKTNSGNEAVNTGTDIIGGTPVKNYLPWAVRLYTEESACSASAVSQYTILTARHCVEGEKANAIQVYFSSGEYNYPETGRWSETYEIAPAGDIALVHLRRPMVLSRYAELNLDYNPVPGTNGVIRGYGQHGSLTPQVERALYQANVSIDGKNLGGARYGWAIQIRGINGAPYFGDSGGPLQVDWKVVGVASTGTASGANINGAGWYSDLHQAKDWIKSHIRN